MWSLPQADNVKAKPMQIKSFFMRSPPDLVNNCYSAIISMFECQHMLKVIPLFQVNTCKRQIFIYNDRYVAIERIYHEKIYAIFVFICRCSAFHGGICG